MFRLLSLLRKSLSKKNKFSENKITATPSTTKQSDIIYVDHTITPHPLDFLCENDSSISCNKGNSKYETIEAKLATKDDEHYGQNYLLRTQENSRLKEGGIPLCVPFCDKDEVKKLGALWCQEKKSWFYRLNDNRNLIKKWLPKIYHPDLTPPFILPNLVPSNLWGINLRSLLPKDEWDRIRKQVYMLAGYRCRICGGQGPNWPVECEEQWEYLNISYSCGIARLESLVSLCSSCHRIKHLGKANIDGLLESVIWHMTCINQWDEQYSRDIVRSAFQQWEVRSEMEWQFDFSKIEEQFNIKVKL